MQKFIMYALAVVALSGCAATYETPRSLAQNATGTYSASQPDALKAARRALVNSGYQITAADDSSGTISTAPRDLRLSPAQADCGTTLGLDYLRDNRTATTVAFGVIIDPGKITVQSTIQGNYRPGAVDQDITLSCVSRGSLEAEMLDKIKAQLP